MVNYENIWPTVEEYEANQTASRASFDALGMVFIEEEAWRANEWLDLQRRVDLEQQSVLEMDPVEVEFDPGPPNPGRSVTFARS